MGELQVGCAEDACEGCSFGYLMAFIVICILAVTRPELQQKSIFLAGLAPVHHAGYTVMANSLKITGKIGMYPITPDSPGQ